MSKHQELMSSNMDSYFEDVKMSSIIVLDEILADVCKLLNDRGIVVKKSEIINVNHKGFEYFSKVVSLSFGGLAAMYIANENLPAEEKKKFFLGDEPISLFPLRVFSPRKGILDVPETPPTPKPEKEFDIESLVQIPRMVPHQRPTNLLFQKEKSPTKSSPAKVQTASSDIKKSLTSYSLTSHSPQPVFPQSVIVPQPVFQSFPIPQTFQIYHADHPVSSPQKIISQQTHTSEKARLPQVPLTASKHSKYLAGGSCVDYISTPSDNFFTDLQIRNGKVSKRCDHSDIRVREPILLEVGTYDDVDAGDKNNPLLCTEYVNGIYDTFDRREQMLNIQHIMKDQEYINSIIYKNAISKIAGIHLREKCVPEVLHLTVSYVNRYLSIVKNLTVKSFELLVLTSFFLADKMESILIVTLDRIVYLGDYMFTKSEIVAMDTNIVETLNFDLTLPTAHAFICRYLKCSRADREMVQIACFIIERVLEDDKFASYLPSMVAASAICISREICKRREIWSNTLIHYTKYRLSNLQQCIEEMKNIVYIKDSSNVIYMKYSEKQFGMVARKFDERPNSLYV